MSKDRPPRDRTQSQPTQIGDFIRQHVPVPTKPITRQQTRLIDAAAEIAQQMPDEIEPAFMAWQLVQATLPHTNPGDVPSWWRKNGALTMTITPGYEEGRCIGYPHGTIPRLVMFWIVTEAVRTGQRRLELGNALAGFMREIGLDPSTGGGKRGDAKRLRDQMTRLFSSRITFSIAQGDGERRGSAWKHMEIAPDGMLWWDVRDPEQPCLFGSWIELGEKFFDAICNAPVPVNITALRALKRSPLALDLYAWATYTAFQATRSGRARFVAWEPLMQQLGADYGDVHNFRAKAKAALRKIRTVYPGLRIGDAQGGVEILPGASAVPHKAARRKSLPAQVDQ